MQYLDIVTKIHLRRATFDLRMEIERLQAENEELRRALEVDEQLLNTRNRVIDAIPPCPEHGPQCISHCLEWTERIQMENARLRVERNRIFCAAQRVAFLVSNTPQSDGKLTRLNDELIGVLRAMAEGE